VAKKRPTKPSEGIVREPPTQYQAARRVSATEAVRNFSEILNRVRYRGETFVIERGGQPICELRPATPLAAGVRSIGTGRLAARVQGSEQIQAWQLV